MSRYSYRLSHADRESFRRGDGRYHVVRTTDDAYLGTVQRETHALAFSDVVTRWFAYGPDGKPVEMREFVHARGKSRDRAACFLDRNNTESYS